MASPEEQAIAQARNLEEKTGRSLASWTDLARATGLAEDGEIVAMLKRDHDFTHGYANLVAHEVLRSAAAFVDNDDLVESQYAKRQALRPIYDGILAKVQAFGGDVEVAPKKAYVSLRRAKQFAIVQPSTATRLDVGIKLPGTEPAGRLEASGSFNSMVTHRVRVTAVGEADSELIDWLREAYDAAG